MKPFVLPPWARVEGSRHGMWFQCVVMIDQIRDRFDL